MLFVGIFVNNSFIFFIFALTVFQSLFLREGNAVVFLDVIIFVIYIHFFFLC